MTERMRLMAKGRDTYAARSGGHDDLVLAVALAVLAANQVERELEA